MSQGDYILDLSGGGGASARPAAAAAGRPFVRVLFRCCNVYQRIYRDLDERGYRGGCPRCGRQVRFVVGSHGTDQRFFEVS